MEVREELRTMLAFSPDHTLKYIDARLLPPIPEWTMKAGELRMIPQYHNAVQAYGDSLPDDSCRKDFYSIPLARLEDAMTTNMGGGMPGAMFWEMKQEVYDIARMMRTADPGVRMRLDFCNKYIPVLEDLPVNRPASLVYDLISESYDADLMRRNYTKIIKSAGLDEKDIAEPSEAFLKKLSEKEILAIITWHFRRDYYTKGSLYGESIANGWLLKLLKAYRTKADF